MKILVITHGFPPFIHTGVFRVISLVDYLLKEGFEVVVLTAKEELKGVQQYPEVKGNSGVCVVRLPWSRKVGSKLLGFLIRMPFLSGAAKNWLNLAKARLIWDEAKEREELKGVDFVFSTSPESLAAVIGYVAAEDLEKPHMVDLRDPWTYSIGAKYRSWFDLWVEAGLEKRVLSHAKAIVANTKTSKEELLRDFRLPAHKVNVVGNGYVEEKCAQAEERCDYSSQYFDIVYTGLSGRQPRETSFLRRAKTLFGLDVSSVKTNYDSRSPLYVLQAISQFLKKNEAARDKIRLRWVGPLSEETKELFEPYYSEFHIELSGAVSEQEATKVAFEADLLLLLQIAMYRGRRDCCTAIPGKTYTYLRTGRPILAALQEGELPEMLKSYEWVSLTGFSNVEAMVNILEKNFNQWLEKGRYSPPADYKGRLELFERSKGAERILEILSRVQKGE